MTLPTDWMRSAVGRSWGQVSQSLRQGAALFSRLHAVAWPGCLLSSHGYETQLPDGDHETQLQAHHSKPNNTAAAGVYDLFISLIEFLALSFLLSIQHA